MTVCTPIQAAFFARMTPLMSPMAARLGIDVDFLFALCAFEDAWGHDAHNDALHNLCGITQAGGRNLSFVSDQACCDYWESHYGAIVKGSVNFSDFEQRIRSIGYNSKNPSYDRDLMAVYRSVVLHKAACKP